MHNANIPLASELPSSTRLLRSTVLAAATAGALLVTVVLPAEYGIDPTGAGRLLGLTEMGQIKLQLQQKAEADRAHDQGRTTPVPGPRSAIDRLGNALASLLIAPAAAQTPPAQIAPAPRSDTTTLTLKPGEGAEVKVSLPKGASVTYSWKAQGGVVNHDTHGEPHTAPNDTHSYKRGRGVAGDEGTLQAAFDGNHGWFWRNRGTAPVTITLTTSSAYSAIKRMM